MTWLERGRIHDGGIVLDKPLSLPEGTAVAVQIEAVNSQSTPAPTASGDFTSLPFFGMWADRQDMADSAQWLRKEREQWQQRTSRRN